jgi:hypothetical protein
MYARRVLERLCITDCQPTTCPVAPSATLEAHVGPAVEFPSSQAVGSVMYLVMDTRPDLAYSVGLVSRFASNLGEVHVKVVKRILCYLRATIDIELTFGGSNNKHLDGSQMPTMSVVPQHDAPHPDMYNYTVGRHWGGAVRSKSVWHSRLSR